LKNASTVYFTLAEHNGFVVRWNESPARDDTKGVALYPSHPVQGETYTDDAGMVWTAVGTSKIEVGDDTFSAADVTATVSRVDLQTLNTLIRKCFLRTAAGTGYTQVSLKSECRQSFTTVYSVYASVSHDLALAVTAHRVTVEIQDHDFGIRDATTGLVSDIFPTGSTDGFVFAFDKTVEDSTFQLSRLTSK
jgi:hypothetical protein